MPASRSARQAASSAWLWPSFPRGLLFEVRQRFRPALQPRMDGVMRDVGEEGPRALLLDEGAGGLGDGEDGLGVFGLVAIESVLRVLDDLEARVLGFAGLGVLHVALAEEAGGVTGGLQRLAQRDGQRRQVRVVGHRHHAH